jgi:hypothetical protein
MGTFAEYLERKRSRLAEGVDLEKYRLGQNACEIVDLLSDPETRFALVPLTEGEYRRSLELAEKLVLQDNAASAMLRDQVQKETIIYFAARELRDLTEHFFSDQADVTELDAHDINHIYDIYLEMVHQISPSLAGLSEEDFDALKKVLPRIEWSDLSGPEWYAAQRFLNSIRGRLLTVNSPG